MRVPARPSDSFSQGPGSLGGSQLGPVAIVEFSAHSGIVANLLSSVGGSVGSSFHIRWRTEADWREEIPFNPNLVQPFVSDATRTVVGASVLFYWKILCQARQSGVLWVSTGPESNVLPDLVFFSVLCVMWRKKMVLSVRNIERWGVASTSRSCQDVLRSRLIRVVPRVVFESEIQRLRFQRSSASITGETSSLPVFFSDAISIWGKDLTGLQTPAPRAVQKLRIGLLGGVDPKRRDYKTVVAALSLLGPAEREKITVVVLGTTQHFGASETLAQIGLEVRVVKFTPYLPNRKLLMEMAKCDVLLAPLRSDVGYGSAKGTGALGDALVSNLMLILPGSVELDQEFRNASIPYFSSETLCTKLRELVSGSKRMKIEQKILTHYSEQVALSRCLEELKLHFLLGPFVTPG